MVYLFQYCVVVRLWSQWDGHLKVTVLKQVQKNLLRLLKI